jgi:hypothetical protein
MWALMKKFKTLHIYNLKTKVRMFTAMVASVGNYGCQVWGVDFFRMDRECYIFNNPMQKLTFAFARLVTGASQSTSRWVLLKELGLLPVQCYWVVACVKFWNNNTSQDMIQSIVYKALFEDVLLFCNGSDSCWVAKLFVCLVRLDLTGGLGITALRRSGSNVLMRMKFSATGVKKRIIEHYKAFSDVAGDDPRVAPSKGVAIVRHSVWFLSDSLKHLSLSAPDMYVKSLMRFRLGCSPLRVHDHRLCRHDRVCLLCTSGGIEDEKHVLFECPAYRPLRSHPKWSHLFQVNDYDMKKFFDHDRQYDVAFYLYMMFKFRDYRLNANVAWNLDTFTSSDEEA